MAIAPIASTGETGLTVRNKMNAAIAKANEVDGKAAQSTVTTLTATVATKATTSALTDEALARRNQAARGAMRPGVNPEMFTDHAVGGATGQLTDGVNGTIASVAGVGPVWRVTGQGAVALRERFPITGGELWRVNLSFRRATDPSDPNGDTVRAAILWLDKDGGLVSRSAFWNAALFVGPASTLAATTVGADEAMEFQPPAGATDFTVALETFGLDGVTQAEAFGVQRAEWTAATATLDTRATAVEGRATAVESGVAALGLKNIPIADQVYSKVAAALTSGADWRGALAGSLPGDGVTAVPASVSFVTDANIPIARYTDLTSVGAILLVTHAAHPMVAGRTYSLTVRARLVGATTLGTAQANIRFAALDSEYSNAVSTTTVINLTADYLYFTVPYTAATTGGFLRAAVSKNNAYTDATGKIEVALVSFLDESLPAKSLPNRAAALETAAAALTSRVDAAEAEIDGVPELEARTVLTERGTLTVQAPNLATADAFSRSLTLAPTAGLGPVDSVTFAEVSGRPTMRFTDLTGSPVVIAAVRKTIKPKAGSTYRMTCTARLVGATSLGTQQFRLQFVKMDGSYVSAGLVNVAVNLTATDQTFVREYTAEDPAPANLRVAVYKNSGYTDATGVIEVTRLEVQDRTNGAELPSRVTALEDAPGGGTGSNAIAPSPVSLAMASAAVPLFQGTQGRQSIEIRSTKWFTLQPMAEFATVGGDQSTLKVDCGHMIDTTTARIAVIAGQSAKIYAGSGRTFGGRMEHTLNVTGPALLQIDVTTDSLVSSTGTTIWANILQGTGTFTTEARPIMERSIAVGGQSNGDFFARHGGIGGFLSGVNDAAWVSGNINHEFHWINGATGGTALLKASNDSLGDAGKYWYDDDDDINGPALTTCLAAISAAVAAGQPAPEVVFWSQGESDVKGVDDGSISVTRLQAGIETVLGLIRAHCISLGASAPQVLHIAIASHDVAATRRVGISRIRQAYQQAIAALAWFHRGASTYDISRAFEDIHWTSHGYFTTGRRMARAYAIVVVERALSRGPTIQSVTVADDRRTVTVTLPSSLRMPAGRTSPGLTLGGAAPEVVDGAPGLFCIVAADRSLVRIAQARFGTSSITLTTDADIPSGATLHFPAGYCPEARTWDFPVDGNHDPVTRMAGLPLMDHAATL